MQWSALRASHPHCTLGHPCVITASTSYTTCRHATGNSNGHANVQPFLGSSTSATLSRPGASCRWWRGRPRWRPCSRSSCRGRDSQNPCQLGSCFPAKQMEASCQQQPEVQTAEPARLRCLVQASCSAPLQQAAQVGAEAAELVQLAGGFIAIHRHPGAGAAAGMRRIRGSEGRQASARVLASEHACMWLCQLQPPHLRSPSGPPLTMVPSPARATHAHSQHCTAAVWHRHAARSTAVYPTHHAAGCRCSCYSAAAAAAC